MSIMLPVVLCFRNLKWKIGRMWDVIVLLPDHCFSIYFVILDLNALNGFVQYQAVSQKREERKRDKKEKTDRLKI